jgi:hypothetical protein
MIGAASMLRRTLSRSAASASIGLDVISRLAATRKNDLSAAGGRC